MTNLRVAVVGVGHLGSAHARVYAGLPGVAVAAVVDPVRERAEAAARATGAEIVADVRDLAGRVDAASVVVPTVEHEAVARELLGRGIPCLVEKPLAKTVEEADRLVALARRSGVLLQVGHIERFNPAVAAVQNKIGPPRFVECHRLSPFKFRSTDVDVVMDLMIHDIDILLHLVQSPVIRVEAVGVPVLTDREDIANARIVFESGCVANVTASRVSDKAMRKIRIFAPDVYASLDTMTGRAAIYRKPADLPRRLAEAMADPAALAAVKDPAELMARFLTIEETAGDGTEPLRRELESFVACVRAKRDPVVTGEHGRQAMAVADAVIRSIREAGRRTSAGGGSEPDLPT
jgi:predicted dehydrogenase